MKQKVTKSDSGGIAITLEFSQWLSAFITHLFHFGRITRIFLNMPLLHVLISSSIQSLLVQAQIHGGRYFVTVFTFQHFAVSRVLVFIWLQYNQRTILDLHPHLVDAHVIRTYKKTVSPIHTIGQRSISSRRQKTVLARDDHLEGSVVDLLRGLLVR